MSINGKLCRSVIIIIIAIIIICNSVKIIPAGHTGVVLRLGAVNKRVMQEGLSVKIPFIEGVVKIDNRVKKEEVSATSASKDLQTVSSTIAVNYRVMKQQSSKLYQNVGNNFTEVVIAPTIQECVKAVTAGFTAEQLITDRQSVSRLIKDNLEAKLSPYGIAVEGLNITNFDFSTEFNKAIEAKQTAQQQALKAEQDLARIKVEAEQKITEARAEAEAFRLKQQSLTKDMIALEAIKKWDGKLPEYYGGNGGMLFNIPVQD